MQKKNRNGQIIAYKYNDNVNYENNHVVCPLINLFFCNHAYIDLEKQKGKIPLFQYSHLYGNRTLSGVYRTHYLFNTLYLDDIAGENIE